MTSEGKDRSRAHMYRFGQILVQNSPLFFLMLHTDPVSVPFFFCVMSVSTSVCITIFSILVITPNPNCSSIMPSTPLEDCLCPRDPHYSNVRQATAEGPGQVDMSKHWLVVCGYQTHFLSHGLVAMLCLSSTAMGGNTLHF